LLKLKQFLNENPDYDLSDISKLKKTIPNGEHASDFRYVIGGLLMKNIYKKEGIKGLVESLKYGTSDKDLYKLIDDKLKVTKDDFDEYIKVEMKNYNE
jgi:hypothetical protein